MKRTHAQEGRTDMESMHIHKDTNRTHARMCACERGRKEASDPSSASLECGERHRETCMTKKKRTVVGATL